MYLLIVLFSLLSVASDRLVEVFFSSERSSRMKLTKRNRCTEPRAKASGRVQFFDERSLEMTILKVANQASGSVSHWDADIPAAVPSGRGS